jgi:ethanolamine utilization protein EutN
MFLGKVIGTVWSTKKTPDLEGVRFLVVHPYDMDREPTKNVVVVADRLGAGAGEVVMCAYGKAARTAIGNQDMSIEAAVVGIVDRVDLSETQSEELREAARTLGHDNGRR